MLKLLLEKDRSGICADVYKLLKEKLSFAKVEKREDERYIVLFIEPGIEKNKHRNSRKEFFRIVKTVAEVVSSYAVFCVSKQYIEETVNDYCGQNQYFDIESLMDKISEGVMSELRTTISKYKKHNWLTMLYRRVIENMLESGLFAVNSFFRFRLSDFKSYVQGGTERILERLSEEIKYMEFIEQLQCFVDKRRPKLYEMKVKVDDTGYTITDGNNEPVDFTIYEAAKRENIDKEDLLIGVLLVAAPVRILVSADDAFFNTNLFSTMSNIFGERIIVDYARNEN